MQRRRFPCECGHRPRRRSDSQLQHRLQGFQQSIIRWPRYGGKVSAEISRRFKDMKSSDFTFEILVDQLAIAIWALDPTVFI